MMIGALVILIASPTLVFLIVTQTPHVPPLESRVAASTVESAETKDAMRSGNSDPDEATRPTAAAPSITPTKQ